MILVADVGGTHTRLALAEHNAGTWRLSALRVVPTGDDVAALIAAYRREFPDRPVAALGCCGAGPVDADGRIELTNAAVRLDPRALARAAGAEIAVVVNDFAAVARAVPALGAGELRPCGGGPAPASAPCVVLGPGTGLGVALLVPGEDWRVLPGEGGHVDLAAADEEEMELLHRLRAAHGRVCAETVLSGPGLERLYAALAPGERLRAEQVAAAAWQGREPAVRAVHRFTRWLGHFAGGLALTAGAGGGVYIAGGIVPAWGERFDAGAFRAGFEDQPRFSERLRAIPAYVVTHPQPGLLGAALLAEAELRQHSELVKKS
ncbi:MAG: ROK family protein [Nevskia sp.]|nr:ROK family protein [Nevskia sp.]